MEELKSRLQNNDIPQATPYGDDKFNFSNGMEFWCVMTRTSVGKSIRQVSKIKWKTFEGEATENQGNNK